MRSCPRRLPLYSAVMGQAGRSGDLPPAFAGLRLGQRAAGALPLPDAVPLGTRRPNPAAYRPPQCPRQSPRKCVHLTTFPHPPTETTPAGLALVARF